ncbi:hypothetical protein TNCV_1666971 [Trichonephila clavipes]|nr:hypothetical protein TNCV_1666971 [Trichonephila clavipes]
MIAIIVSKRELDAPHNLYTLFKAVFVHVEAGLGFWRRPGHFNHGQVTRRLSEPVPYSQTSNPRQKVIRLIFRTPADDSVTPVKR